MGYLEKAILINLFGDEEGIGEAWDLYELATNRKKFEAIFIVIIGVFFLAMGGISLIVHLFTKSKSSLYAMLITGGLGVLISAFGIWYYFKHK